MDPAILADPTDNKRTRGRQVSETHATAPVFPPGRYGRRREGRRNRWVPIVAVLATAAALLGVTIAFYDKFGQTDYTADIIGWNDPTDAELVIKFRVRVPEGGTASCMLRARDYDGFEVGRRAVLVPAPEGGGSVEVSESVATKARASVGDIMGCRAAG
ncbi:DUF4307 domain-containing protein [Actinoplanes sp. NPDC051861]|uniref:DUF4307 domain-containing protein n=1 Tax=Actinoplanes sp. NPDC051861 TaxID=3155170 RepID=UPI003434BD04